MCKNSNTNVSNRSLHPLSNETVCIALSCVVLDLLTRTRCIFAKKMPSCDCNFLICVGESVCQNNLFLLIISPLQHNFLMWRFQSVEHAKVKGFETNIMGIDPKLEEKIQFLTWNFWRLFLLMWLNYVEFVNLLRSWTHDHLRYALQLMCKCMSNVSLT
jgi:hypothetical protein